MSFTKKINVNDGSGRKFEDNTVGELEFDTTPQLGSFNPVTSDGVAKAISGASGEVPVVNPGDAGKVLTAGFDGDTPTVSWEDAGSGVPEYSTSDDGKVLGVVDNSGTAELQWVAPTKVEYENQELKVQPPDGAPSLTIDTSDATPVTDTEPYSEGVDNFISNTLVVAFSGNLGGKDLTSCTLHIPSNVDALGITLNDLEFNYYSVSHGEYTEESISPMVVTGATSASPSRILAGDYVVPLVPNPDSYYDSLCVKITYSGSPDQADLDAFISFLEGRDGFRYWTVTGDVQVAGGYSLKPAVLPSLAGNAGKVLAVNSGATGTEWVNVGRTAGDGIKIESGTVSAYHGETLVDKALPLVSDTGADSRNNWINGWNQQWLTALKVKFGDIVPNSTLLKISIKNSSSSTDVSLAMPYTSTDPDLGGKKVKLVFANPDNLSNYIEALSASNVEITQSYSSIYNAYTAKVSAPASLFDNNFQSGFNWHGLTLADIQGADGSTLMYLVACASDGTLITTGSYGPTDNMWTVGFGNALVSSATTYALVEMPSNPVGFDVKNPVPDTQGVVAGSVLAKGSNGMEWVAGGVPHYEENTSGTVSPYYDNSVITSTVDVTSITVDTATVKSAIVQWTVASTTTLPTVLDGNLNPLKASVNNPASLTVGRTVQVSILNGTWVCAEFA